MSWLTQFPAGKKRRSLGRRHSKLRTNLRPEALERRNLMAVVATDLPDYAPGSTAHIYSSGFQVGEAVQFQVLHNDGTPNTGNGHTPWTVVDGSPQDLDGLVNGNIHTTWYVDPDDSNHSSFNLTANGQSSGLSAMTTFTDVGSTLSQFANLPATNYQTGSLNGSNSAYVEGDSIPFRYLVSDLQEGACVVLDIIYQFQSSASGPRTYDYLTTDNVTQGVTDTDRFGPNNANKPSGFGLTTSTNLLTIAIPDDPSITTDTGGSFRVASNVPVSLVSVSTPAINGSRVNEKVIHLVLQLGNDGDATPDEDIVDLGVFWGGHLARDTDYAGTNNGASDAPGASFHMRTEGYHDLNCDGVRDSGEDNLGGGDRSMQSGAVVHTSLAWEKRRADTNALQGGATFTITPDPLDGVGSLTITDNGPGDLDPDAGQIQIDDIRFGTYTITETVAPAGFNLDPDNTRVQSVTSAAPIAVVGTQGQNDPGITDESDFHNPLQLGSIAWEKRNEATGALLGGATFTIAANPLTGTGSLVVVDDTDGVTSPGDVDKDPAAGQFLINNVLNGTYTVTETMAPAGFLLDDAPSRTVTVSGASAVIGVQGVINLGNTNTSDFFNTPVNSAIEILKVTKDGGVSGDGINILAGEAITWEYTVTNAGNVPLSNVTVTDNQAGVTPTYVGGDTNNNSLLDLAETWIFSAAGTSVVGRYSNVGTATGDFTDSSGLRHNTNDNDPSSYFGLNPQIAINKVTVDGAVAQDALIVHSGESIAWRYTVTNAGNVALANVAVTDDQPGVTPVYQSGDANNNGQLDLTETWVYVATGTSVAGNYSNIGTATGSAADAAGHVRTTTASDGSSYFAPVLGIAINKVTVDGPAVGDALIVHSGESISWRYTVTNTGNITLNNVTVTDDQPGVTPVYQSGDANNDSVLDLDETWVYVATGTSVAGNYANVGTASGSRSDAAGHVKTVSASDGSSYFAPVLGIAINKVTVAGANVGDGITVHVNDPISWRYTVTNTGNITLNNVTVTDNQPGVTPVYQSGDANNDGVLDLSEIWVYTASGTAIAGNYSNVGTAMGSRSDAAGHVKTVSASDASSYVGLCDIIVIGPDKQNTSKPLVKVVNKDTGAVLSQFYAYEPTFKGGVRLTTADMTGDGIDEIIVAPGRGRAPEVRVFTQAGVELTKFRTMAYATNFLGGVEVAVGDIDGNGTNDLVTVPTSGVTQARVFYNTPAAADPLPNTPSRSFNVFPNNFLGGADVVVADMGTFNNGTVVNANVPDGKSEIIIGNGPGLRSTVYVYDMSGATPKVVDTILPFSNTFKGGITLDAARINGDLIPDLIIAAGNGGGSAVQVYNGITNDAVDQLLTSFNAFSNTTTPHAPVHTTTVDSNNDGIADSIVAVQGTDGTSNQIRCFNTNGTPKGTPLNGFTGPWNIARLRCPSPQVHDLVFAEFGR